MIRQEDEIRMERGDQNNKMRLKWEEEIRMKRGDQNENRRLE